MKDPKFYIDKAHEVKQKRAWFDMLEEINKQVEENNNLAKKKS